MLCALVKRNRAAAAQLGACLFAAHFPTTRDAKLYTTRDHIETSSAFHPCLDAAQISFLYASSSRTSQCPRSTSPGRLRMYYGVASVADVLTCCPQIRALIFSVVLQGRHAGKKVCVSERARHHGCRGSCLAVVSSTSVQEHD